MEMQTMSEDGGRGNEITTPPVYYAYLVTPGGEERGWVSFTGTPERITSTKKFLSQLRREIARKGSTKGYMVVCRPFRYPSPVVRWSDQANQWLITWDDKQGDSILREYASTRVDAEKMINRRYKTENFVDRYSQI